MHSPGGRGGVRLAGRVLIIGALCIKRGRRLEHQFGELFGVKKGFEKEIGNSAERLGWWTWARECRKSVPLWNCWIPAWQSMPLQRLEQGWERMCRWSCEQAEESLHSSAREIDKWWTGTYCIYIPFSARLSSVGAETQGKDACGVANSSGSQQRWMQEDPSQTGYSKIQFVGLYVCTFKICLPAASMKYFNTSTGNLQVISWILHVSLVWQPWLRMMFGRRSLPDKNAWSRIVLVW